MLGGSHSKHYSMWRYGEIATDGLKEIAEWGNTYKAESEMKANVSMAHASAIVYLILFCRLAKSGQSSR